MQWLLGIVLAVWSGGIGSTYADLGTQANAPKVLVSYSAVGINTPNKLVCELATDGLVHMLRVKPTSTQAETIVKRIRWSSMVTAANLKSMIDTAKQETVGVNLNRPVKETNGNVVTYSAYNGTFGNTVLLQTQNDNMVMKNQSNAAELLLHFIDLNCGYGTWRTDASGSIIH